MSCIPHILSSDDLTPEYISNLLHISKNIIKSPDIFSDKCKGKILATLFFEPSTRTRLSFESAMHRLGGSVIGFSDPNASSTSKGESLTDTVRTVSSYSDIIVIRHPKEGAAYLASKYAAVPLINAGDGGHQHPTQTLTDLLTINQEAGQLDNITIAFCGDLKFGRTVHSLSKTLALFKKNRFIFVSPEELKIPDYIKAYLDKENIRYIESTDLDTALNSADILYMTRVQRERFFNEADYVRLKDSYILDKNKLLNADKIPLILHPLPRVNEIAQDVDDLPQAVYFKQVSYGVIVRQALILKMLEVK